MKAARKPPHTTRVIISERISIAEAAYRRRRAQRLRDELHTSSPSGSEVS